MNFDYLFRIIFLLSLLFIIFLFVSYKYSFALFGFDLKEKVLYEVNYIYDGDTISIKDKNNEYDIRLLGINTPESVDKNKDIECYGKESSDFTNKLLKDKRIRLSFDDSSPRKDKYGRYLAYVYRDDGLFINKYLVENGMAKVYLYNKPFSLFKEFKKLEYKAYKDGLGLWDKSICKYKYSYR